MNCKISSYEGPIIAHLELEDDKWLKGIRRYLESREYLEGANKSDIATIGRWVRQFTLTGSNRIRGFMTICYFYV